MRYPGSFRDHRGYVVLYKNEVVRCITESGVADVDHLFSSGLYRELVKEGLLLEHEEIDVPEEYRGTVKRCYRPQKIPFVNYPYEWSIAQFRDAALVSINIARRCLSFGMILSDGSAYNVMFINCRPVFIDLSSIVKHSDVNEWSGYRQYTEQVLLPILLSRTVGSEAPKLLCQWMQGIPLSVGWRMLDVASKLRPGAWMHIAYQAYMLRKGPQKGDRDKNHRSINLAPLFDNIVNIIKGVPVEGRYSKWRACRASAPYDAISEGEKERYVSLVVDKVRPAVVWDIGCNDGKYSRIASRESNRVIAMDADGEMVGHLYAREVLDPTSRILPLLQNIAQPSPACGWGNSERQSLEERGPADLILYLAVMHHVRYVDGIPIDMQMKYLARLSRHILLEWIPNDDVNVRKYLESPQLSQLSYGRDILDLEIRKHFDIRDGIVLSNGRELLHLEKRHKLSL